MVQYTGILFWESRLARRIRFGVRACPKILPNRKKVRSLSKEAISRVLEAEAEANAIRERARAEAREKVSACETACARENEEVVARTAADMKARREMVRERSEALITQSREEVEADIETIRATSAEKMREAVKHIEWELCDI